MIEQHPYLLPALVDTPEAADGHAVLPRQHSPPAPATPPTTDGPSNGARRCKHQTSGYRSRSASNAQPKPTTLPSSEAIESTSTAMRRGTRRAGARALRSEAEWRFMGRT